MGDENRRVLARFLGPETKKIIEVGTWLGLSARFMCDQAPNAKLFAIDHWKMWPEPGLRARFPNPWLQFVRDCWDYRDHIVPIRIESSIGIEFLGNLVVPPDLVYLDGAHDYATVLDDIQRIVRRWPNAVLVGDDWTWDGVRQAAQETFGERLNVDGNCWWVTP